MAESKTPQARINTRSLEVVSELKGDLAGHKDMDALQFANVRAELTEIKGDIKQLSTDAKGAIDLVAKQNADNHKTNTDTLQKLAAGLSELSQRVAVGQGKSDGERGFVGFLIKVSPIALSAATLAFLIWGHGK